MLHCGIAANIVGNYIWWIAQNKSKLASLILHKPMLHPCNSCECKLQLLASTVAIGRVYEDISHLQICCTWRRTHVNVRVAAQMTCTYAEEVSINSFAFI